MDAAYCDHARADYCRCDVYRDTWDKILRQFMNMVPRHAGGKTPCIQGYAKQGMTRHNVKIPLFDELIKKMEKI